MNRPYRRELVHGTVQGYIYRGCRCEECRQAQRDYYGNRPMAEYLAEVAAQHGTERKYRLGCRCDECREGANAARRRRRHTGVVLTHNNSGYANGCRCEVCTEAHRVYRNERR